jgi:hypothetical protein
MSSADWRGVVLPALLLGLVACGNKPGSAKMSDPNAPAVVRLPPPVLPSDTAKPDTMAEHTQKIALVRSHLMSDYATLGASIAFGDRRVIASFYAPEAVLVTPDGTRIGVPDIATTLASLGRSRSIQRFDRTPIDIRVIDSTVVDSGRYVSVSKRAGADSVFERGSYVSTWRIHQAPLNWVLKRDELRPGTNDRGRK